MSIHTDQLEELLAITAQRDQLQALSVTNVMLDIVPGMDGMGEEVYAKSVEEVSDALGKLGMQVEDLQGDVMKVTAQRDRLAERLRYLESALCVPGKTVVALNQCNTQAIEPERVTAVVGQRDRLLEALEAALVVIESYEVQVEGEWGFGRSLSEIESDGDLNAGTLAVRAAIASVKGGTV